MLKAGVSYNDRMKKIFEALCQRYSDDLPLIASLWEEIVERYSKPHRYYHTLEHLEHLYRLLIPFKDVVAWESLLFTLFYHDIVYDVPSRTNEQESALLARERLQQLNVPLSQIEKVVEMIIATQHHSSQDTETQIFLDADLAILGSEPTVYQNYLQKIRQEYQIFSDEAYRQGRIAFLQTMVTREPIFHHPIFYQRYEAQAKANLKRELYNYTHE